jgi:hypothetical protein
LRQRQSIGGRAGRHEECSHLALKYLAKAALKRRRPIVITITARISAARFG